ncbi:GspJ family T2SS minor pseudopilin variant LspJ [Legionella londiniensis]|uniref:Type II secretion system protein J n=1 Tax=Legionella londiniensis TaxID=45068 RepID=A0A0W0VMC2_9GAMM|nr:GspJ family T2SS minor pseudopilin variant LspJ [Legionella londiniensis]KTD21263.1 type II secretory pathway protein LspJ [Legionella londiniensis]STX93289.1 general secretion pathway protein J [Legionella londiniensis]
MKQGYTLIEILIALAVFAILAAITGSAMYHAFNTRERLSEAASRINALQLTLTIIERDSEQMIDRFVLGNGLQRIPAFVGHSNYMEFTRDGLANPDGKDKRSTLQRIAYLCQGKQLIRRGWIHLDMPNRNLFEDKILLDNLANCSFSYLNQSRQVLSEWHEGIQKNQNDEPLPIAIRLTLDIEKLGHLSLLFIVPEALYHAS